MTMALLFHHHMGSINREQGINSWSVVCCGDRNRRRKACCPHAPQARKPPAGGPGGPPGRAAVRDFFCDICTNIWAKTEQQSAFKRLPKLEKACTMP